MYVTEMKMPSNYSTLSIEEMEYDGQGFFGRIFKKASKILKCIAVVCAVAACAVVGFGGSIAVGAFLFGYAKFLNTSSTVLGHGSYLC